ncbi:MAG: flagellar biosynthetic protein FliR [Desulfovibrionaceae bacterium]|nr:flagellar biosynthetic protein FliR [Desulfovibrionaceae bacterium]
MDIFAFNADTLMSFLLTLTRVSLVVFLLPFFGGDYIPVLVKAALALVMAMAVWPHLSFPGALFPSHPWNIALMVLGEAVLGLIMGLCVSFIFAGIQTGGEIMGFQMGFTMMTLADPASGNQASITSNLLHLVTLVVFLALDGHLHLLRALSGSFALVPPGSLRIGGALTGDILTLSGGMFSLAVKIAAPAIAALFMVELTLALMGRAAPQMNLLTLGFPVKIAVGFFFMGIMFTTLSLHMEEIIIGLGPMFDRIMALAGGPQ